MSILRDTNNSLLVKYAYYNQINDNNEIINKNIQYLGIRSFFTETHHHIYETCYLLTFKLWEDSMIEFNYNTFAFIKLQKVLGVIEDYGTDSENEYISDVDSEY